tara:strand:+ start:617 stop:1630 length:1014 start_codon:yes stop_codon:yes gene_type:complete
MKITCHNKDCKFQFEYNGNEMWTDCPKCSSKVIIKETSSRDDDDNSRFRNYLRNWVRKHPKYNPYNFSKDDILGKITSKYRLLPDFLIFGGTRSGAMTLQRYLIKHPTVYCKRNIHFFEYTITNDVNWYKSHFPTENYKNKTEKKFNQPLRIGEQTGTYMFYPEVPSRVQKTIPNVKLIAVLRNPIDMVFSRYNHMRNQGIEVSPFDEAVNMEIKRMDIIEKDEKIKIHNPFFENSMIFNYIRHGNYAEKLKDWFKHFSREQFLIFTNTELTNDTTKFVKKTFEFLGLEPINNIDYIKHNVGEYPNKMDNSTKKKLEDYFKPFNEELNKLLERNLNW